MHGVHAVPSYVATQYERPDQNGFGPRGRDTYAVVVNTCGPATHVPRLVPPPSPPDRAKCHDLAASMVDLIEDDTIDPMEFAQARDRFAATCTPR
jgi:hypothetical protein